MNGIDICSLSHRAYARHAIWEEFQQNRYRRDVYLMSPRSADKYILFLRLYNISDCEYCDLVDICHSDKPYGQSISPAQARTLEFETLQLHPGPWASALPAFIDLTLFKLHLWWEAVKYRAYALACITVHAWVCSAFKGLIPWKTDWSSVPSLIVAYPWKHQWYLSDDWCVHRADRFTAADEQQ